MTEALSELSFDTRLDDFDAFSAPRLSVNGNYALAQALLGVRGFATATCLIWEASCGFDCLGGNRALLGWNHFSRAGPNLGVQVHW